MIQLKRILAPIDNTPFEELGSFETENYIGIYADSEGFVLMPKGDDIFNFIILGFTPCLGVQYSLEDLDRATYDAVEENIQAVSTSRTLKISISE